MTPSANPSIRASQNYLPYRLVHAFTKLMSQICLHPSEANVARERRMPWSVSLGLAIDSWTNSLLRKKTFATVDETCKEHPWLKNRWCLRIRRHGCTWLVSTNRSSCLGKKALNCGVGSGLLTCRRNFVLGSHMMYWGWGRGALRVSDSWPRKRRLV